MGKRIEDPEFLNCLKKGKIRRFSQGKALVEKESTTAEKDLLEARESLKREKFKWATIQTYYSMFHSARALLYNENYREKSHHCLIVALRVLYVKEGRLSARFVEELQKGKNLRESADYYDEWSKIGAEEIISLATEFLETIKNTLKK